MPKTNVPEEEKQKPVDAQFKVEKKGETKADIKVTVDSKIVDERFREKIAYIKNNVPVKGYRIGMAPEALIKRMFKKDLNSMIIKDIVATAVEECAEKKPCNFIGNIEFTEQDTLKAEEGKALNFTFKVDLEPEVELKKYKGFSLTLPSKEPSKEDIEKVRIRLLDSVIEYTPVNKFSVNDDWTAVCDVKIKFEDKEPIVASNVNISNEDCGFTFYREEIKIPKDKLIKLKKNESLTFEYKTSKDFIIEEMRGKQAKVELKINSIKNRKIPEVTEEIAKTLKYKDVKEFNDKIKRIAKEEREAYVNNTAYQKIDSLLIENNDFELPDTIINFVIRQTMGLPATEETLQYNFAKKLSKKERSDIEKSAAANTYKIQLILEEIAKKEDIKVEDKDIEDIIEKYAEKEKMKKDEIEKLLKQSGRIENIKTSKLHTKVYDFILSTCKLNYT